MASSCAEHPQVVGDGSGAAKGSEGAAPTRPSTQKAARHLSSSRVHRVLRSWHPGLMVCPRERQSSLADPGAASGGRATGSTTGGHTAYRYSTSTLQVLYEYNSTSTLHRYSTGALRVLYGYSTGTLRTLRVLCMYSYDWRVRAAQRPNRACVPACHGIAWPGSSTGASWARARTRGSSASVSWRRGRTRGRWALCRESLPITDQSRVSRQA